MGASDPGLADPLSRLAFEYDAIVVGSGYGGAIAAARLAEAGAKVCVLERGREWRPGDFPTDEVAVAAAFPAPFSPPGPIAPHGQPANDLDVVVGCGLGGTSLINAGISLRPESLVFEQPEWPRAIREAWQSGDLDDHYARAEAMLGAQKSELLFSMEKVKAHKRVVTGRGITHATMPLNVTRANKTDHGLERRACTSCGDCVAGCNVGAKNTLATNYLPFAKKRGAKMFTGTEVRRIEPDPDGRGWIVEIMVATQGSTPVSRPMRTLRSKIVVLGAGSMGSTEILLRARAGGLPLSKRLGDRFSANADILGFSYNGRTRTNVLGYGSTITGERDGWPVGTTISSYGDYRTSANIEERFLLLEGAVPTALVPFIARAVGAYAMLDLLAFDAEQRRRIVRDLEPGSVPGPDGALNHSMLYLACGHDSGTGRLVLSDVAGRVSVSWPGASKERCFARITEEMEAHTRDQGGYFLPNPRSALIGGRRQMTVHPLGGCPMADDVDGGVVDHRGRVFHPNGGFHAGLYIADGGIVPRSLGVTPLLTISALAERVAEGLVSNDL